MTFGLKVYDASAALIYDSTVAVGGVVVDVQSFGVGASGTLTYPAFSGYSAIVITRDVGTTGQMNSAVVDYGLGYPRVTVSAVGYSRTFIVVAY